jgi:predicted acylesterase/phospholipase RssA
MTNTPEALLPSTKELMPPIPPAQPEYAEIRARTRADAEVDVLHGAAAPRRFGTKSRRLSNRPPFECIALLLQGGGALGSYQAGVYEALAEANLHPDWVAGISIGAINSAIIAGNPPTERVSKLRDFWGEITANPLLDWAGALRDCLSGDFTRRLFNQISANWAMLAGATGFFAQRQPPAWLHPEGAIEATSFYDTKWLRSTLERFVDFERINSGEMRLSVGAVNVRSGNFVYFDTTTHAIAPEHVMASGSLPPGFPAVEIEGEYYWDGGLISNTPLQWVVDSEPRRDTLAFQVEPLECARRFPAQHARCHHAGKRDPVFEPHTRQYGPVQICADPSPRACRPHAKAAGGFEEQPGSATARQGGPAKGLQHRSADLSRAESRRALEGL